MKKAINCCDSGVYMRYMSQIFILFRLSNVSVLNLRFILFMYTGSLRCVVCEVGLTRRAPLRLCVVPGRRPSSHRDHRPVPLTRLTSLPASGHDRLLNTSLFHKTCLSCFVFGCESSAEGKIGEASCLAAKEDWTLLNYIIN